MGVLSLDLTTSLRLSHTCIYIITKTIDRHAIILNVTCKIISIVRTREL